VFQATLRGTGKPPMPSLEQDLGPKGVELAFTAPASTKK